MNVPPPQLDLPVPVDTTHWEETQPVSPAPGDIPVPVQAPALCCVPLGTMPTMQAPPAHPVQRGTIVPLTACLNLWRVPQATIKPAVGKPAVPSVGKVTNVQTRRSLRKPALWESTKMVGEWSPVNLVPLDTMPTPQEKSPVQYVQRDPAVPILQ